jgi:hypothetical protein
MLEIKKTVVSFEEKDLIEIEKIVIDNNETEALRFIKKAVYDRISHAQQSSLKSHLDGTNSVDRFKKDNK